MARCVCAMPISVRVFVPLSRDYVRCELRVLDDGRSLSSSRFGAIRRAANPPASSVCIRGLNCRAHPVRVCGTLPLRDPIGLLELRHARWVRLAHCRMNRSRELAESGYRQRRLSWCAPDRSSVITIGGRRPGAAGGAALDSRVVGVVELDCVGAGDDVIYSSSVECLSSLTLSRPHAVTARQPSQ